MITVSLGVPQIIVIVWMVALITYSAVRHGQLKGPPEHKWHVGWKFADVAALFLLLYWGGFFSAV